MIYHSFLQKRTSLSNMTSLQIYVLGILIKDNIPAYPSECIISGTIRSALFKESILINSVPVSISSLLLTQKVICNVTFQPEKSSEN